SSLANDTLSAWKLLHAYFRLSAARVLTSCTEQASPRKANSCRTTDAALGVPPMTRNGGRKKSATLVPSRRNSGTIATCRSSPTVRPDRLSSSGTTSVPTVRGGTVERMITVCGRVWSASAAPMSDTTRRTEFKSVLPLAAEGVPTHTIDTSDSRTLSPTVRVACRALESTTSVSNSGRSCSTTGGLPALTSATLPASVSMPTTWCPRAARQVAVTVPTYPSPKSVTFTRP